MVLNVLTLILLLVSRGNANPGLLSAMGRDPLKFKMVFDGMALDSLFMSSSDMGVRACNFTFMATNPVYPHSPRELHIRMTIFMRYMLDDDSGVVTIKAFLSAETRDIARTPDDFYISPTFTLSTLDGEHAHKFSGRAVVHSYWDPPAQSAMVYGLDSQFRLAEGMSTHDPAWIVSCDVDTKTHTWFPARDMNLLDGRGIHVPPVLPHGKEPERETFVVLKPLYNFSTSLFGPLIFRHVEYYQSLGVSKHVIYLRRESIPALLVGNPKVARLIQKGKILLIMWDGLQPHELWSRRYDQRVVYSHAILAFTGIDVYLVYIDLDEYLVTTVPELQDKPIHEIIQKCSGTSSAAELKVMRYHTLCKDCDHSRPETFLWGPAAAEQWPERHPLTWYQLTNYISPPLGRSIINPNFMRAFYLHWGSLKSGYNTSFPDGKCMFFLHVLHLIQASTPPEKVKAQFVEDTSWAGTLKHIKLLRLPPEPLPKPQPPPPPRLV